MTSERYQRINQLFNEVLEHAPDQRSSWLEQACAEDVELRSEVEKLLTHHDESGDFLSRPAMEVAVVLAAKNQNLTGQSISHYQILAQLGAGGMGQVFLAKDTKLGRQVALKLLPAQFIQDADYLRRFEREALAASALNHPNILTIYESGAEGDTHFLATEFVQGETLRDRIGQGNVTIAGILDITIQIASALQAAHEANIIHRDIKPENVMIRQDGIVKVLDFGLAKLAERNGDGVNERQGEENATLTTPGTVMGTVAYMSPEQARGKKIDTRSDLFSLGVVLYEMLTHRQPFTGETINHTIVAILEREPEPITVSGQFPSEIQRIVKQCLAKNVNDRYQNASELLTDLKKLRKRLDFEAEFVSASPTIPSIEAATQIIKGETLELEPAASKNPATPSVDIAHVLFCDIVQYSTLPIDQQTSMMRTLQEIVQQTDDYRRANEKGQLVRLPAGDGMALAFLQDAIAPVRCAIEITKKLKAHPAIQLRMGAHSGHVYHSSDINANRNVVGSWINIAQRVMDCGDAGHILVSRNVAEVLDQISDWHPLLHNLGEHEVKHGVTLQLFNLYSDDIGNAAAPAKLQLISPPEISAPLEAKNTVPTRTATRFWLIGALIISALLGVSFWQWQRLKPAPVQFATTVPERNLSYSLTVQKYRDGKPFQSEFQSSGREIFEPGWRFKLNLTSPQEGYLYLLNEEPGNAGSNFVLLLPLPSYHNGSAHLAANEKFQTNWYMFDEKPGTEQFRLVWAAEPVPELEALRELVNANDKGRVSSPVQIQAVQAFLAQHATSKIESVRDQQNNQTNVNGRAAILVTLVELEHH